MVMILKYVYSVGVTDVVSVLLYRKPSNAVVLEFSVRPLGRSAIRLESGISTRSIYTIGLLGNCTC